MSLPLVLRREVEVDLQVARDWYEKQRAGLGEEFVAAVDQTFARIVAAPELYGVVLRDLRRARLRRFPYVVYYRLLTDRVEIIAVLHGSRNQRIWQDRAD